ncbi:MAG: bifunctional cobalt-precorrin-7 (C(5))-methyltransferase/cobalt-precorrin-6B (C(15))-methyltransferase, partial [Acidimicrobiales bacterium]
AASASRDGVAVCILTSGDPGFFGIVHALSKLMDRRYLRILPAPSSVSLAFARLAMEWEDAVVVRFEQETVAIAVRAIRLAHKAAVLTSTSSPPEMIGQALEAAHSAVDMAAVCSRLGYPDESVDIVGLHALAVGRWDPDSVVVLIGPAGRPIAGWGGADSGPKPLSWGLPDNAYIHGRGMVTEAEARAVALGKLALPATGILWDVGAGAGALAVEAAMLCPDLTVFAIEERDDAAARIARHTSSFNVNVRLVHGKAPLAFRGLPDPDRVFVGGGGIDVLEAALGRLSAGGRIAAMFKTLDHAAAGADRLGHLIQLSTNQGRALPGGGWRLDAGEPVFLAWGPRDHDDGTELRTHEV